MKILRLLPLTLSTNEATTIARGGSTNDMYQPIGIVDSTGFYRPFQGTLYSGIVLTFDPSLPFAVQCSMHVANIQQLGGFTNEFMTGPFLFSYTTAGLTHTPAFLVAIVDMDRPELTNAAQNRANNK